MVVITASIEDEKNIDNIVYLLNESLEIWKDSINSWGKDDKVEFLIKGVDNA